MPDRDQLEMDNARLVLGRVATLECAVFRLRDIDDETVRRAGEAWGTPLPVVANTATGHLRKALWLAPGEWLLAGDGDIGGALERVAGAVRGKTHHLVNVTSGRVIFSISGSDARDFLARSCSLDLHPRALAPNACAQSLFAQVPALLHLLPDGRQFHLYADASYDAYLSAWFDRAARTFDHTGHLGGRSP
jgi:sarcosine oxidase subunit gamma